MKNLGGIKIIMITALVLIILAGTGAAVSLSNSGGGTWKYQREISIKENSGTTLTDYQVLIELKGADFPLEVKSDGADIRFTDSKGNELNHWIESWDYSGKSGNVWVKLPSIPAGSSMVIRMNNGNPSASDVSNGEKTFEFFDDFFGTSLNGSKWQTSIGGDGAITVSGGVVRNRAVNGWAHMLSNKANYPLSGNVIVERRFQLNTLSNIRYRQRFGLLYHGFDHGIFDNEQIYWNGFTKNYVAAGTWTRLVQGVVGTTYYWNIDGVYSNSIETTITTPFVVSSLVGDDDNTAFSGDILTDWVKVRKYSSIEPTITLSPLKSSSLSITKSASPYSLRQFQESTIKVLIENSGTSEVKAIEIMDSIHPSFDLTGGDFPNPKKFESIRSGESRELQYTIKSKESGAFTLDPATVTYADSEGNIQEMKSEAVSIKVVPSSEGSPEISSPSDIGTSSAVLLHGEKTDVVLGEDILLKLSAVNLITKPPMSVQVMIYPPSGMSVTGSEFVKSGAGIYTTTYTLNPGDGKDIEVHIKSNQVGDFNVKGRIVYYFGEEKENAEDHTLNLPIKVRKEPVQTAPSSTDDVGTNAKTPGFEGIIAAIAFLLVLFLKRNR